MNKPFSLIAALGLGMALTGCANTLNGAKQDAATDTQKTQQAAQQADQAAKAAAQKAGQAIETVPQNAEANAVRIPVKTAIIRDPILAQSSNLIDVNGSDHTITLTGHVVDADAKNRATGDANLLMLRRASKTGH